MSGNPPYCATSKPAGLVRGFDEPLVLDEVQNTPALFPTIKREVDRKRKPGRFVLTWSANVLLVPKVSESLAGRIEILPLWPFSQGEIHGEIGLLRLSRVVRLGTIEG